MARGIKLKDFYYEVTDTNTGTGEVLILARMLIEMDGFNVGTDAKNVKESTDKNSVIIPAHITQNLNKRQYGIHPRHVVLTHVFADEANSKCYTNRNSRTTTLPILTLGQWLTLKEYDTVKGGTQANTSLFVNHSLDGSYKLEYRIMKKVEQELI